MGKTVPPRQVRFPVGSADLREEDMATASSARYYSDPEIACVVHQLITGLDHVRGQPPRLPWWRTHTGCQQQLVKMVGAARRGASHGELHRLQTGGELAEAGRADRLQLHLLTLVVGAMAGEER